MVCKPGIFVSINRPSRVAKGDLCSMAVAAIKRSARSREPSVQCIGRLPERAATSAAAFSSLQPHIATVIFFG
jgi:hypothetical protein